MQQSRPHTEKEKRVTSIEEEGAGDDFVSPKWVPVGDHSDAECCEMRVRKRSKKNRVFVGSFFYCIGKRFYSYIQSTIEQIVIYIYIFI